MIIYNAHPTQTITICGSRAAQQVAKLYYNTLKN